MTETTTDTTPADGEPAARPASATRRFRPARIASKLSREETEREGRIVRLAFLHLGADAARVFLNTPDDKLGGRPLDLATASDDGAAEIERVIRAMPGHSAAA